MTQRSFKVVGIGELLWDMLPTGKQLGGAPANFIYYCNQYEAQSWLVSAVANDQLGKEALAKVAEAGINSDYIEVLEDCPTGTVDVKLDGDGIPQYTISQDVAWDNIGFGSQLAELAAEVDAVCFGSLSQRSELSQSSIRQFLQNTSDSCIKIFDINLRQKFYSKQIIDDSLNMANVLKINDEELDIIAEMFKIEGSQLEQLKKLADMKSLDTIILTCGADGSVIFHKGQTDRHPGIKCKPIDTVGAGDSFTAMVTVGLLAERPIEQINAQANKLAASVCQNPGAMIMLEDA
jgi:fructokinase